MNRIIGYLKNKITARIIPAAISTLLCAVSVFLIVFSVAKWESGKNGEGYRLLTKGNTVVGIEVNTEEALNVVIPDGITVIGERAFMDVTNLKTVTFPETLVMVNGAAFAGCNGLESIVFPDSLRFIGVGAFHECTSISSVTPTEGMEYNGRVYGAEDTDALIKLITTLNSDSRFGVTVERVNEP